LRKALAADPTDAETWSNLGVLLETERGDVDRAEKA
jgi:Flp pilus assembly protein TadD